MRYATVLLALALVIGVGCDKSSEESEAQEPEEQKQEAKQQGAASAGEEGDEHPGEEASGDEHPGDEHPGDEAEKKDSYSAEAIKEAVYTHIDQNTDDSGIFTMEDPESGETLELKFDKVHEPVRRIEGKGYFACTDFQVAENEKKVYDLDFWFEPKGGELQLTKLKIHKHPVEKDGSWEKKARFTYEDDEPVEVE